MSRDVHDPSVVGAPRQGGRVLSEHPVFPILLSTDKASSRSFYRDTLGLNLIREDPERLAVRSGRATQGLVSVGTVRAYHSPDQVASRRHHNRMAAGHLRTLVVRIPGDD